MTEAATTPKTRKPRQKKPEFRCEYCSSTFIRENMLLAHACEKKRRLFDKDTKHVRMGFQIYQKFWHYSYPNSRKKSKTFEDFINFREYSAFTAFAKHLLNIRAINPERFIDFLLKNNVKLKNWKSDDIYLMYIRELSKAETADAAIERNILLMQQWANESGEEWFNFFRKISPSAAVQYIKNGRISPWAIYTTESGQEMLSRLSDEQLEMVRRYIDPDFWKLKFKRNKEDFDEYREMLAGAGL